MEKTSIETLYNALPDELKRDVIDFIEFLC